MKMIFPDHLVIIVNFKNYTSRGKRRDVPNNVRKYLMGKYQSNQNGLPEEVAKEMRYEVILPLVFSLIKRPMPIGVKTVKKIKRGREVKEVEVKKVTNIALGAVAIYRYLGVTDTLDNVCKVVKKLCSNKFKEKYMGVEDFSIMVAKRWFHETI